MNEKTNKSKTFCFKLKKKKWQDKTLHFIIEIIIVEKIIARSV